MSEKGIFKLAYGVRDIVRNMFRGQKGSEFSPRDPSYWVNKFFGNTPVWSGAEVDENTALEYVPYWACVKVLRETIASLPVILYKRTSSGKERATNHSAYNVFHLRANPEQTAYDYKEMTASHFLIYGKSYSEKVYNNKGELAELWPLMPWNMNPKRKDGKLYYFYDLPNGKQHVFLREELLVLNNFTLTGIEGERVINYIKQCLGTGMAADEYGARFYSNDSAPGGIIEMPGHLKKENIERFKDSWEKNYGQLSNKHRTAILEDGAKFHELTVAPDKAQFLETRKFQQQQTAAFHRIPPHLIGDLDRATYTNIEQQSLEFVNYTMLPYFVRFEQNFTTQTLTEKEQKKLFYEFLVDALLRGDIEARYRAYKTGREMGVLSADDIREKENMNKLPDGIGEKYYIPMNWSEMGIEPVVEEPSEQEEPAEDQEPEEEPQEENAAKQMKEYRAARTAATRFNIAASFKPVYQDILLRLIKKESVDIKRGFNKWFLERDKQEFDNWYKEYYQKQTDYIRSRLAPVYNSLNIAIYNEVKDEVNAQDRKDDQEIFVRDYIDVFVRKYIKEHKKNIGLAVMDITKNGADPEERIDETFEGWARNAANDSRSEVVKSSNAFAKYAYILAGIEYLRWVNTGASPCPYCQNMDGKIVGINQTFVQAGGNVETDQGRMEITRDVGHAPLHDGCECQIIAG